ncbi:MAG: helix-turn-helix domain-containing protein [Gammaproteobacteria bacterium]|nr:helix-turn-helix domain-containing protein [Gammaproteobacteria bacterium]
MNKLLDVTIVILDNGFTSTAIGPMEVFYSAGRLKQLLLGEPEQPQFNVRIASIDGKPVTSVYGISLIPHCGIEDVTQSDLVLITASHSCLLEQIPRKTSIVPWLRAAHERGSYLAGVCSGVALVAETGLFCSGGVYASIDLSLYLVEKFCGHEIALECAKSLMVTPPRNLQSGYAIAPLSRPHDDERIKQIEQQLQNQFDKDIVLEAVAAEHAMSPRNLLRRFKAATGHLPGEYLQLLRISAARQLLERGRAPVQKVAATVGYEDSAYFRGIFKRHTGMTPTEYRNRFGPLFVNSSELRD